MKTLTTLLPTALLLVAAPAAALPLQEEEGPRKTTTEELFEGDAQAQELVQLFHEVERALIEIDDQLFEAGAGDRSLQGVDAAGLERLLRDAGEKSRSVIQGIDKILEVASQMSSSSSGSGSPQSPSQGQSPLDAERDRGPQERERTPEAPQQQGGEQPEPQQQQQQGEQPDPKEQPNGADKDPTEGQNRRGDPRDDPTGDRGPRSDDANRWGELPQRVRETFRTQGRDDMPAQYRDWIDAYYRRMNRGGAR